MIVFVVEAFSYDPEDVVGVFFTKEKALQYLKDNGWRDAKKGYQYDYPVWSHEDGWRLCKISEYKVQ